MRKYEVCTGNFEIRCGTTKDSIPSYTEWELYYEATDGEYEIVGSFDTVEDARAFFSENYKDYGRTWAEKGYIWWLLRGCVAWIEINIYDENGEFDSGDGVVELSAEPYDGKE